MSRKPIFIDWQRVDELLEAGCLGTEIAAYFGMHPETFYDKVLKEKNVAFSDYSAKKKATGEALLREAQFKKAIKKLDNSMLIWLGKQRLGQRENNQSVEANEEITIRYLEVIKQLTALQTSQSTSSSSKNESSLPSNASSMSTISQSCSVFPSV